MAWPRYHYAEHTMLEVFTQQRQIPPLNFKLQLYKLKACLRFSQPKSVAATLVFTRYKQSP